MAAEPAPESSSEGDVPNEHILNAFTADLLAGLKNNTSNIFPIVNEEFVLLAFLQLLNIIIIIIDPFNQFSQLLLVLPYFRRYWVHDLTKTYEEF